MVWVGGGLTCPTACGIFQSQPGIELAFPASEGGFFTTGPAGKFPTLLLSVFKDLAPLGTSPEWNHTGFVRDWLIFLNIMSSRAFLVASW